MTDQNAVSAFRAARADAVKRYAGADLETVCAAWVANQKFLDGARPGNYDPAALAVRDALKSEVERLGLIPSMIDLHIERHRPHLLA